MTPKPATPVHPGSLLRPAFAGKPYGFQASAAREMDLDPVDLNAILNGRLKITPRTAVKIGAYTHTDPAWWLHRQADYDLAQFLQEAGHDREHRPSSATTRKSRVRR